MSELMIESRQSDRQMVAALSQQLSWSHFAELLPLEKLLESAKARDGEKQ